MIYNKKLGCNSDSKYKHTVAHYSQQHKRNKTQKFKNKRPIRVIKREEKKYCLK